MYWLSFCDPYRPKGQQFLGVAIVQTDNFAEALSEAWRLKINPGGEARGMFLPEACHAMVGDSVGRLLSQAEAQHLADALNAATSTKH